jgi:hypothetical protein
MGEMQQAVAPLLVCAETVKTFKRGRSKFISIIVQQGSSNQAEMQ